MNNLPHGWTEATLDDIALSVKNGIFVSRPKNDPDGVPILRISSVRSLRLDLSDVRYSAASFASLENSDALLKENDLLFTRYNGNPEFVGACARVPALHNPLTYPDKLIRVRIDERICDSRFAVLAFAAPAARDQARSLSRTTAGQIGISGGSLRRIRIPLPPLSEQRRIVATLEEHLSRLSAAQHYIDRASNATFTMRTSLRARAIVGHRESVMLDGPLNPGWTWGRLGDLLVDIEAGKSFTCEPRRAEYDEWGVIKVSAMTWGEFREEENKAVPDGRKVDSRHEIHPGDVLVSRANTEEYVGAPVLVRSCRRGLLLSDKSLRLVPKSWVDKEWLVQLLASSLVRRQISMTATGNQDSMRNISQRDLRMIRVPIPPEEDQARIADSLRQQLDGIDHQSIQVDRVKARATVLRRSLLADAFAGKLVPQDPAEEPALMLLDRIRVQRAAQMPARRGRGTAKSATQKEMLI